MKKTELTQERLKQLLSYDPETGVFRWRVALSSRGPVGSIAGCVNSRGYRMIRVGGKGYRSARLAWLYVYGEWPREVADHIFGDKLDDRISKLRSVTTHQNCMNRKMSENNTSGFRGVYWHRLAKKWYAQIRINKRVTHLGFFPTAKSASLAYEAKAEELFGEFRRIA
jgi:hypothetical protein